MREKTRAGLESDHHRLTSFRMLVQAGFLLFTILVGYRFFRFFLWASGQAEAYVPRPPSVEGFLPISALMGLKQLLLTGLYDQIHPAGLTILLSALALALLARKGFCGWICPVGAVSNLVERGAARLRLLRQPPGWVHYPLLSLKYLILGFFGYLILWRMELASLEAFMRAPYNLTADARMLQFFLAPSTLTLTILAILAFSSLVVRNFWCRYCCPYGALLGLVAVAGPWRLRRDPEHCTGCRRCQKACPAGLPIVDREAIWQPECIGCGECLAACPQKGSLRLFLGGRSWSVWLLPGFTLGIFFIFYGVAVATGNWTSQVPELVFKRLYSMFW